MVLIILSLYGKLNSGNYLTKIVFLLAYVYALNVPYVLHSHVAAKYSPSFYNKSHSISEVLLSLLTLYGHFKTAEQRTIIQQYCDSYTGRWLAGCYIWYSDRGGAKRRDAAPPSPLLAAPNVTARPLTPSVPTSYIFRWGTVIASAV